MKSLMSTTLLRVIVEDNGHIRGDEPLEVTVVGIDDGAIWVRDGGSTDVDEVWPVRFERVGAEWINPLDPRQRLIPRPVAGRAPTPRARPRS